MEYDGLSDSNVKSFRSLSSPQKLREEMPLTEKAWNTVYTARTQLKEIFTGKDDRKLIVVGPCSINDINSASVYAERLASLSEKVKDKFFLAMRTYFEKPRTTKGWKGLINDPEMNGCPDIEKGRRIARKLLLDIAELGLPTATETLCTRNIQCYDHLISYACIGARTTEAQTHRELASGLTMPVGFKNGTKGDLQIAIDAVISSREEHQFAGMDYEGKEVVVETKGNIYTHIILRGGEEPNYHSKDVIKAQNLLKSAGLEDTLVIDCSHGNSGKNHEFQPVVFKNVMQQIKDGNRGIVGLMIESNLKPGKQNIPVNLIGFDKTNLEYGVSVTDSCLGWDETQKMILEAYDKR